MRQFLCIISLTLSMLFMPQQVWGADSTWKLYFYSTTYSLDGDVATFQTTDQDDVFKIENLSIAYQGISFNVHNSNWSTTYGWKSVGVTTQGVDVELGTGNGNCWLNVPVGSYDVTFNLTNKTIRFDWHTDAKNWYFYNATNDKHYQFLATDDEHIYTIEKFDIQSGMCDAYNGIDFNIVSEGWADNYVYDTTISTTGSYILTAPGNSHAYWNGLYEGMSYTLKWNSSTKQLTIEDNMWYITEAGEAFNERLNSSANGDNIYTLNGFTVSTTGMQSFKIRNSSWSKEYVCNENITNDGTPYTLVEYESGVTWNHIYCYLQEDVEYTITWNKDLNTLRIEPFNSANYTTYSDGHAVANFPSDYLRGGDISMLNYVEDMGAKFYDAKGVQKDPLQIMKENGVNFVRLRLYNNPGREITYYSGSAGTTANTYRLPAGYLDEDDILKLAKRAKAYNMKIELTFHYSDFWTNGEAQIKPLGWESYTLDELKTAVYDYTYNFLQRMNAQGTPPEYVSLGNEVQSGILFGYYNGDGSTNGIRKAQLDDVNGYIDNMSNLAQLMKQGDAAVRAACPNAQVVIHMTMGETTSTNNFRWLLDNLHNNHYDGYDIIGASYYPYWTNKKPTMLNEFANTMYSLYSKPFMIMEVGYSWTPYRPSERYGGNYMGQLELNGTAYNEATKAGQKSFMQEVQTVVKGNDHILGYLYWDPVMVEQKVNGTWIQTEWVQNSFNAVGNTTWFDYEGKALPVLEAMAEDAPAIPYNVDVSGTNYTVEEEAPYTLTVGSTGYSTFYDVDARTIPAGITAYTAETKNSSSVSLNAIDGDILPAATGVLIKGDQGTYYMWKRNSDSSINNNMLHGTQITQTITPEAGDYYYYKLANDPTSGLGWYWGAAGGGVFTNNAHKAYLALPQSLARSYVPLLGDEETDGIRSIEERELRIENYDYYNLKGQRVGKDYKGIVIVNGKKIMNGRP